MCVKILICSISFFLIFQSTSAKSTLGDTLTLDQIVNNDKIHFELVALGGHSGECLELYMLNNSADTIAVIIEPGRIFFCENDDMQNLVVMRSLYFKLAPKKALREPIFAFCCVARKLSPNKNTLFRNGFADEGFFKSLGAFVQKHDFPIADIQSAVWVISDNHSIASICGQKNDSSSDLKFWLSKTLNRPFPWYCIEYDKQDTSVFQNKHLKLTGVFKFRVPHYSTVNIQVRDKSGRIIDYILNSKVCNVGEYDFPVNLNVHNWPKGTYEIIVFADGNRINKPTFFDL
jgi:hypothetical protein